MAYTTVIRERAALERELLAAVVQRSPSVETPGRAPGPE